MSELAHEYREGEGTPVVFIHGWLGSMKSWTRVLEHLDIENPVLLYDQRCHGESFCEKFSFEDLADDLHALVKELGIEEPVLVGHSMGGMTALQYSTTYSVKGLFLLGTAASNPEPANESVEYFLENLGSMPREEWAEKIAENYTGGERPGNAELAVKEMVSASEKQLKYPLEAMIEYDVRDDLEPLSARVITGKHDRAITMDKSRELAELLDAEIEVLDTTHLMLWEVPGEIAGLLEEFLSHSK